MSLCSTSQALTIRALKQFTREALKGLPREALLPGISSAFVSDSPIGNERLLDCGSVSVSANGSNALILLRIATSKAARYLSAEARQLRSKAADASRRPTPIPGPRGRGAEVRTYCSVFHA
jgi:hypothetical protein